MSTAGAGKERSRSAADGASEVAPQQRNLARQGSVIAALTGLSRVSGFLRDILLSYLFGASALADAFFVAFKIPNFFRRLFAEGAFSQAFVPILARYRERPFQELRGFVSRMFGNLALVLVLVTVIGWIYAAGLVTVFAPGFLDEPARFTLTVDLVRIVLPYLTCISLVALASSILNAHDRFALPAFAPVVLNLCMICAALLAIGTSGNGTVPGIGAAGRESVAILAWGVLIAGLVQLVLLLPPLKRLGLLTRPRLSLRDPGVRDVGRLLPPALFAASVAQINTLVDTILASLLITGSISWLYYADRMLELPIGLVAVTLGTVLLPNLSRLAAADDPERFRATVDWGVRVALLLALPAAVALYVLALPIIATMFRHGAATAVDAQMAALALKVLATGLFGWVLIKVLAPAYFAHKDTATPFRYGVAAVALNIGGNLALYQTFGHVGLALATAASGWLNAGLLLRGLVRNGRYSPSTEARQTLVKVVLASAAMAGVLLFGTAGTETLWLAGSILGRVALLLVLVAAGAATYALVLLALGVRPSALRYRLQ